TERLRSVDVPGVRGSLPGMTRSSARRCTPLTLGARHPYGLHPGRHAPDSGDNKFHGIGTGQRWTDASTVPSTTVLEPPRSAIAEVRWWEGGASLSMQTCADLPNWPSRNTGSPKIRGCSG